MYLDQLPACRIPYRCHWRCDVKVDLVVKELTVYREIKTILFLFLFFPSLSWLCNFIWERKAVWAHGLPMPVCASETRKLKPEWDGDSRKRLEPPRRATYHRRSQKNKQGWAYCFQQWCHIDDKRLFFASVFSVQNDLWNEKVSECPKSKPKVSQESPRCWVSSSFRPTHKALRQQGSGRSPGGGNGNPPQCSCLENSMDGGAWWATVHGVAKESDMFWETKQQQKWYTNTLGIVVRSWGNGLVPTDQTWVRIKVIDQKRRR